MPDSSSLGRLIAVVEAAQPSSVRWEPVQGQSPGDGGQVDDVPAPPLSHSGQHGLGHPCQAEEIDLQHPVELLLLALLDRSEVADAGVVHQDVDTAEVLLSAAHSLGDLDGVGDVQPQRERAIFVPGDEVFDLLKVVLLDRTRYPWASTTRASSRPNPVAQPVMNHVEKVFCLISDLLSQTVAIPRFAMAAESPAIMAVFLWDD